VTGPPSKKYRRVDWGAVGYVVLAGDEQLRQVEDLGPSRFMLGSPLLLRGNLGLELGKLRGPVDSGMLGRQLRAGVPDIIRRSQVAAAFDAVEREDQLARPFAAAKLWPVPAKAIRLLWFLSPRL
jgi:hypothetical protein